MGGAVPGSNFFFSFLTFPALTKSFGAEMYGLWAQIVVTIGLLNPILTLHLGTATVRYLAAENKKKILSHSFSNMLWVIVLISLITILTGNFFKMNLSSLLFINDSYNYFIILMLIWASTGALFTFLTGYLRAKGRIKKLSLINMLCYFFKFIPLVVLAVSGFSLYQIIVTQIIVELIFILILFGSITKNIGFKYPNTSHLKKYLLFSIPQIPSGALLWIIDSSDRYFITSFLGLTQTGIYSASYSIGSLISIIYIPISFVIFPVISNFWENGEIASVKKYLEYSTKIFLFAGIPCAAGLYILSRPMLQLLTTSEFLVGGGILTFLIALSTIFLGIFQINLYIICLIEKTKFMPIIVGISAAINVILNIILIPKIGITGAAVSTIFSYMLLTVIVIVWAHKNVHYDFDFIFLSKVSISSFLMVLLLENMPIISITWAILAVLTSFVVYIVSLLVLKSFTEEEKKFIYGLISSFKSQLDMMLKKIRTID